LNNQEKLLYLRGVAAEYFDYSGQRVVIPFEQRLLFLQAVGYDINNEQQLEQAIFELDAQPWTRWLKPFNVMSLGDSETIDIQLPQHDLFKEYSWQVTLENGELVSGSVIPGELPEVGEYFIDGVRYSAHRLSISDLPMGYHQIKLSDPFYYSTAELVVAPSRCYELPPTELESGDSNNHDRLWGLSCQLYTLRSSRNWGIGDFTDLRQLIHFCADAQMDFIGLNPLHAPHFSGADFASPYSPSDRRFLNPLYIDPEASDEFINNKKIAKLTQGKGFKQKLKVLRDANLIDYDGVAALKYWVFEELYTLFLQQHIDGNTSRGREFQQFVESGGEALRLFCEYECHHSLLDISAAADPRFHQYLQWLAHQQLQQCQVEALAAGMKVGLMGDLAVGAVKGGAEIEGKAELFCTEASIGAPPDHLAENGQNWALPALDPVALRRDNYRHFIELLRANMSYGGALRIDHVMGLLRLWWCLPEFAGAAYVYYPFETMLALMRLESHRNCCLVVGEDMGVVPDELRQRMSATAVYGNKLFYFEKDNRQQFKQPEEHTVDALLMVTNHDVPTLAGWWNGSELSLKHELGLLSDKQPLSALQQQSKQEKLDVLQWLECQYLLPEGWAAIDDTYPLDEAFDLTLCEAITNACARSRSRMMSLQLEDLQLIEQPVNIPGTYREYPNWRRKQQQETQTLFGNKKIQALLASTYRERMQ
jgi:4-alpha-glucanotransferase